LDVVVVAPLAVAWLAFLSSSGVGAILTVFLGMEEMVSSQVFDFSCLDCSFRPGCGV
jgi:hypothetical protein